MPRPGRWPATLAVALSLACAHGKPTGLLHQDHPLVGKIWDVGAGRFVDEATFHGALRAARYVALGETHDNPVHHQLQARALAAMVAGGRHPGVAFEMLDAEQQPELDAVLVEPPPHEPDAVARAVRWNESGWPDFALYRPIFAVALDAGLPIVAANLGRKEARAVVRTGEASLPPSVRGLLQRAGPLPERAAEEIRQEMSESHCGELPRSLLDPFVTMQRARDAQIAERAVAGDRGDGTVLIAGSGHTRKDRGATSYLALAEPERSRVAVAFLEVSPERRTPEDIARAFGPGGLPFDYVAFTPALAREDPCAGLRGHDRFRKAEKATAPPPPGTDL